MDKTPGCPDIERVGLEIPFAKSKSLLVGNIYRLPNTSSSPPNDIEEKFEKVFAAKRKH